MRPIRKTDPMDDEEVLATVAASPARRWLGIVMLGWIGILSIYVALARPPELIWQIFLISMGVFGLWMATKMMVATRGRVELTRSVIRDSDGHVIVQCEDILSVDRGLFAFKPSNGFLIRTRSSGARRWQPGLWWRMGRRIGIGGVTPGHQTKMMSDILSAMLMERSGDI